MIDDFRPAPSRPKSLQAALDDLQKRQTPASQTFTTPDQVASDDDLRMPVDLSEVTPVDDHPKQPVKRLHHRLILHWPPRKKEYLVSAAVVFVVVSGIASWLLMHPASKPVAAVPRVVAAKPVAPQPTTVPSVLSGLPVDPSTNTRPITAVMVENSDAARPQAGLSQAGVVFEAIAEGGVTRFMALYQDQQPTNVGPIRSARPYYVQWALGFDAPYAHVGGSPDALADIKAWKVRDLNQFYNGGSFHRIASREAPHNVYTGIPTLEQLEATKGYTSSAYSGWPRKADAPAKLPTASTINLTLSGPDYNAKYNYSVATNSYNRSEGGAVQTDSNTNAQLSPKVVIVLVTPESRGALDSSGAYYSNYNVLGSGQAYVFQDGTVTIGQWSKAANTSALSFTDAAGQPLKLNAGQTWITAVTTNKYVTYTP